MHTISPTRFVHCSISEHVHIIYESFVLTSYVGAPRVPRRSKSRVFHRVVYFIHHPRALPLGVEQTPAVWAISHLQFRHMVFVSDSRCANNLEGSEVEVGTLLSIARDSVLRCFVDLTLPILSNADITGRVHSEFMIACEPTQIL